MQVLRISSTYGKEKGHFFNHKEEAASAWKITPAILLIYKQFHGWKIKEKNMESVRNLYLPNK